MVTALLLLIIAIALFGSGFVIGAIGWATGFIALTASAAYFGMAAGDYFSLTFEQVALRAILALLAVIAIGNAYLTYRSRQK